MSSKMSKAYEDLGRRLALAYTSWHMGYKGVDYILKRYEGFPIHESWAELGKRIHDNVPPVDWAQKQKPELTLVK